ncbi:MAG: PAS domain-containing protein, partial [Endomicrobium sp.]|nr:PAS domain-containing protein [Endomicrobium sp.]
MINADGNEITSTVAMFSTSLPTTTNETSRGFVIYFWESHTDNLADEGNIQATSNLLHRTNLLEYEKYEVRTGYLSRWNYMPTKDIEQVSPEEIKEAIRRGYEEQDIWLKRCNPDLPNFIPKDWQDCISEKQNPYYTQCKELILQELKKNKDFDDAFKKSINSYAERHAANPKNGEQYILEEISWIFSLPLLHLNKHIFLVHVGNYNPAIKEMVKVFSNLNKAVKLLSPRLKRVTFQNEADFLMYYNVNNYVGCSYPMMHNKSIMKNFKFIQDIDLKEDSLHLEFENREAVVAQHIIEKLPAHIYWLNRKNVYLGCNEVQAENFGLKSAKEIVGKTNFDFHEENVANELNKINELVMSRGEHYEGEEPAYIKGQTANCVTSKIPIFNIHGKCIGLIGVSFDVTEKKKIEKLQNKLKIQKELYKIAKEVAHDIASPISSLRMVQYISEGKLSEKETRMMNLAIRSIEDMCDKLISKYRRVKDIEEGTKSEEIDKSELKNISPYKSLLEIVKSSEYRYQDKSIKFKTELDEEGKIVLVKGDPSDFGRMMSNIINNGIEAAEGKKVEIEVTYKVIGEEVEIMVKDNGKGMPKEMAQKIEKGEEVGTTKKEG